MCNLSFIHSMPGRRVVNSPAPVLVSLALGLSSACGGGGKSAEAPKPAQVEPTRIQPSVTAIVPPAGPVGTELTLHGSGLDQVNQVLFGKVAATRFEWVDDKTIKVWVPEGTISAPITVRTHQRTSFVSVDPFTIEAHPADPSPAPPADPGTHCPGTAPEPAAPTPIGVPPEPMPPPALSRMGILELPFVEVADSNDGTTRKVDSFPGRRSQTYSAFALPKAPLFHPYHLLSGVAGDLRDELKPFCQVNLNLKLPLSFQEALPATIKQQIKAWGVNRNHVQIFCVSQNQPWNAPMLFRPHYWAAPDSPSHSPTYGKDFTIRVGLFEADPSVHFTGHTPGEIIEAPISLHPGEHDVTVASPDNMAVSGLDPLRSQCFWTFTEIVAAKSAHGQSAATLHLLLNDADQTALEGLMLGSHNLRELISNLERSSLAGTPMVAELKKLARPIVDKVEISAPAGFVKELHIKGSGFTETTMVTIGAQPYPGFTLLNDGQLILDLTGIPAGTHDLIVTTAHGVSAPRSITL